MSHALQTTQLRLIRLYARAPPPLDIVSQTWAHLAQQWYCSRWQAFCAEGRSAVSVGVFFEKKYREGKGATKQVFLVSWIFKDWVYVKNQPSRLIVYCYVTGQDHWPITHQHNITWLNTKTRTKTQKKKRYVNGVRLSKSLMISNDFSSKWANTGIWW